MIFLNKEYWEVKTTKNKGKGLFAKKTISPGTIIGDYIGKVICTKDVDLTAMKDNLYLMYYHDQASIYPDLNVAGIHLLNHSCSPNCWIYTFRGHTLVFALKKISPGDELTISYLLSPKTNLCNPCSHTCKCGSDSCTKTFHLSEVRFNKWRNFQEAKEKGDKRARVRYGSDLKLLPSYPTRIPESYIKTVLLNFI